MAVELTLSPKRKRAAGEGCCKPPVHPSIERERADRIAMLGKAFLTRRVPRPGGQLAVSDVIADDDMDERARRDMQAWTGCIAGALTRGEFIAGLHAAGLEDIEIRETHRVHRGACSALIRAGKPGDPA